MTDPGFHWPSGFAPDEAKLYVRNELTFDAPLEAVWEALIHARSWHDWFSNATDVKLPPGATKLALGVAFTWKQTGIGLQTTVKEFEPMKRVAWYATSPLIRAYHTWDVQSDGKTTRVITDETQNGFLPSFFRPILKPRMLAVHDKWLACLKQRATQKS